MTDYAPIDRSSRLSALTHELGRRIVVLDGGMGTEIQKLRLGEQDYRGQRFAGWHRDCRPSFNPEPAAWLIEPTSPQARPLSEIVDFTPKSFGPTSGVFENRLGGRVAVFGYYPWRFLQSLAKTSQLKAERDTCKLFANKRSTSTPHAV